MTSPRRSIDTFDPAEVRGRNWTRPDTLRVGLAAATLAGGALLARRGVPELEAQVFRFVNGLPDAVNPVVWPVMQAGSLVGGLALAAALGAKTRNLKVAVSAGAAVATTWVIAKLVKDAVGRERPFGVGLDPEMRDHGTTGLGYVSGHTAIAVAIATVAAPHLPPRVRWIVFALAAVVGLSRIYVGAHLPLDVLGGAALGMLVGEGGRAVEVAWRDAPGRRR